jgi:hypothetical protein
MAQDFLMVWVVSISDGKCNDWSLADISLAQGWVVLLIFCRAYHFGGEAVSRRACPHGLIA